MSTAILYRTAPMMEHKAAKELREAGIRAYVPADFATGKRKPTARGYVFARTAYANAFAKHVKATPLGTVAKTELARLYLKRQRRRAEELCPYVVGQAVRIGEVPAIVTEIRGRTCIIETTLIGKPHRQAIPYAHLRPG